jgi:serine/alanine adding enzyme
MPTVNITTDTAAWNAFVSTRPEATLFHSYAWADSLAQGAGHRPYFLAAQDGRNNIVGVLPLCLVESRLFGRFLVSLPHYLGGVCAVDDTTADALLAQAIELAKELKADTLEIRGNAPLPAALARGFCADDHKASFLIDLSAGEAAIWKGLRKQNRNRVRKGEQSQPTLEMGHYLLDEFWKIFSMNTRAIGSVTFAPRFFGALLDNFGENAQVLLARQAGRPVAAKLVLRYRDTLTMLWGGTVPQEKAEGLNYWLTWETLRYAIATGCTVLDMGRSTVDSGPYHFKSYWGGAELRHHWYSYSLSGRPAEMRAESPRFRLARRTWRKLPLGLTRKLGPWIARQIP